MLLPLIGFVLGVAFSYIIGFVVLSLHPKIKVTFRNLTFFVFGTFLFVLLFNFLLSKIFTDNNGSLNSFSEVIGYFITLIISTIFGGIIGVIIGQKIEKNYSNNHEG